MNYKITSELLAKSLTIYDKTSTHTFSKLTLLTDTLSSFDISQDDANLLLASVILFQHSGESVNAVFELCLSKV